MSDLIHFEDTSATRGKTNVQVDRACNGWIVVASDGRHHGFEAGDRYVATTADALAELVKSLVSSS